MDIGGWLRINGFLLSMKRSAADLGYLRCLSENQNQVPMECVLFVVYLVGRN
jgi:hypothetical protein